MGWKRLEKLWRFKEHLINTFLSNVYDHKQVICGWINNNNKKERQFIFATLKLNQKHSQIGKVSID